MSNLEVETMTGEEQLEPGEKVIGMNAREVQRMMLVDHGEYYTLEEVEVKLAAARQEILANPALDPKAAREQRILDQAHLLQRKIDAYKAAKAAGDDPADVVVPE